jgi:RNA polymerase sigma-70 factor (ECF subfamily)
MVDIAPPPADATPRYAPLHATTLRYTRHVRRVTSSGAPPVAQDTNDGGREAADPRLEGASSSELVRRLQHGEPRALDVLFERYRPILRRWAAGRLPRWARELVDTEDMIQDAMVATMRNIHAFVPRHAGAFGAYLRQALHNRIRDEVRKAQVRPQRTEMPEDHPDRGASPVELAIGRQALDRYEAALARLSVSDRELVLARIELGLDYAEIAETTGKPSADATRMAVARALLKLANEMSE